MRTKLYEAKVRESEKYSAQRKSLIGSGDRSKKSVPTTSQSCVTDHRIGYTSHNIDGIMAGSINELTDNLQKEEMEHRLQTQALSKVQLVGRACQARR